jgi:hypothetical protein
MGIVSDARWKEQAARLKSFDQQLAEIRQLLWDSNELLRALLDDFRADEQVEGE